VSIQAADIVTVEELVRDMLAGLPSWRVIVAEMSPPAAPIPAWSALVPLIDSEDEPEAGEAADRIHYGSYPAGATMPLAVLRQFEPDEGQRAGGFTSSFPINVTFCFPVATAHRDAAGKLVTDFPGAYLDTRRMLMKLLADLVALGRQAGRADIQGYRMGAIGLLDPDKQQGRDVMVGEFSLDCGGAL
jgi:hypothetical protein